jgi:molybdate transport system substrate-binding protein
LAWVLRWFRCWVLGWTQRGNTIFFNGLVLLAFALMTGRPASAAPLRIAVAANFAMPAKSIATSFTQQTGVQVDVVLGATGKLYAQIKNGAPFDVFLSADATTPLRLEQEGDAVPHSRVTYAVGRLVLWSAKPGFVDTAGHVLSAGKFNKLAVASPKVAPYGAAALETLGALGLRAHLEPKFVTGESIGQAFGFVSTGNADLGFVALSQVMQDSKLTGGSAWLVPAKLHSPLQQDAVVLARSSAKKAAAAFMQHLQTPQIKTLIRSYGYDVSP